jgi:hypothetical protein
MMLGFKFTGAGGVTHGDFAWPLPTAGPGKWVEVGRGAKRPLTAGDLCTSRVLHAIDADHLLDWANVELYEVEIDEVRGVIVGPDKIGFRRGRLLRRVEGWNDANLRHFAADCAEDALQYADPDWRETLAVVIHTARAYADGAASEADLDAARDATWAPWAAATGGPKAAARAAARDGVLLAARAAVTDAARDAAADAAWDAAAAAAWDAAAAAATAAAWDAAADAAMDAATDAAWDAVRMKYRRWLFARIGLEAER